jgi:hypothetical protein
MRLVFPMTLLRRVSTTVARLFATGQRRRLVSGLFVLLALSCFSCWCFVFRPWEAHYRGRPSSYWIEPLIKFDQDPSSAFRQWYATPKTPPVGLFASVRAWLESVFEDPRVNFRPHDPAFIPVLDDLLKHPKVEVQLAAAKARCFHGKEGFRKSLPALINAFLNHPDETQRWDVLLRLRAEAESRQLARTHEVADVVVPVLRGRFDSEKQWTRRDAIVHTLEAFDPQAAKLARAAESVHFGEWNYHIGKFPAASQSVRTGWGLEWGPHLDWQLTPVADAPSKTGSALAQMVEWLAEVCDLCIFDEPSVKDVELNVALKVISGKTHQGGGLLWRYQSAKKFYLARLDPVEDNLRVDKVIGDKRIRLAAREGLKLSPGEWHTLCVQHVGDSIKCWLNGTLSLEVKDSEIDTAGRFGLWTEADALTYFSNSRVIDLAKDK